MKWDALARTPHGRRGDRRPTGSWTTQPCSSTSQPSPVSSSAFGTNRGRTNTAVRGIKVPLAGVVQQIPSPPLSDPGNVWQFVAQPGGHQDPTGPQQD